METASQEAFSGYSGSLQDLGILDGGLDGLFHDLAPCPQDSTPGSLLLESSAGEAPRPGGSVYGNPDVGANNTSRASHLGVNHQQRNKQAQKRFRDRQKVVACLAERSESLVLQVTTTVSCRLDSESWKAKLRLWREKMTCFSQTTTGCKPGRPLLSRCQKLPVQWRHLHHHIWCTAAFLQSCKSEWCLLSRASHRERTRDSTRTNFIPCQMSLHYHHHHTAIRKLVCSSMWSSGRYLLWNQRFSKWAIANDASKLLKLEHQAEIIRLSMTQWCYILTYSSLQKNVQDAAAHLRAANGKETQSHRLPQIVQEQVITGCKLEFAK